MQRMVVDFLILIVAIVLVVVGANWLTDGASALAKRLNISDLVIGLTVVAFGTSAPELSVSLISALRGSSNIALGNVVGSNIFNVLLILGVTSILKPIPIGKTTRNKEIPFAIFGAVLLMLFIWTPWSSSDVPDINRLEGVILFLASIAFIYYTVRETQRFRKTEKFQEISVKSGVDEHEIVFMPLWKSILFIVIGLVALVFGGRLFVSSSSAIATALGVSDAIIALTLVAGGTSLPELATSAVAAYKGKPEIAIGNVVGSNIFNIFLVLGASATISPLVGFTFTRVDIILQVASIFLVWVFVKFITPGLLKRWQGIILTLLYVLYIFYLIRYTIPA